MVQEDEAGNLQTSAEDELKCVGRDSILNLGSVSAPGWLGLSRMAV